MVGIICTTYILTFEFEYYLLVHLFITYKSNKNIICIKTIKIFIKIVISLVFHVVHAQII